MPEVKREFKKNIYPIKNIKKIKNMMRPIFNYGMKKINGNLVLVPNNKQY